MPRLRVTRNSVTGAAVAAETAALAAIDPYFEQTKLLLHLNGSNGSTSFVDSSIYGHVVSAVGDAKISTAQSQFGGASATFDGSGDYLTMPSSGALILNGDFTIEAWVRVNAFVGSNLQNIVVRWGAQGSYIFRLNSSSLQIILGNNGAYLDAITANYSFASNTWYHVAASRSGSTVRLFANGVLIGSGASSANTVADVDFAIGSPNEYFNGYIDDVRVTAAARYTTSFSLPTSAYPDTGTTSLWTPALISNQVAWWDATETTAFTYATGTNVSSWASKVGAYSLSQATASSQPTRSGTINGKTSVVFDGTSDFLSVANLDLTAGGQAITMWFACYYGYSNLASLAELAAPVCGAQFQGNRLLYYKTDANGTTLLVNSTNIENAALVSVNTTDGALSTNETVCWVNGSSAGDTFGYNANTSTPNSITTLYVGRQVAASGYFPGQIAEMGIIAGVIGTSDRQKLEGYLAHKWGTSSKLPNGHPYKTALPTLPSVNYDPDATTYIAAVEAADGQSLDSGVKTAINDFIVGCKADGNWSALKASCILAGARTLAGALVPLVGAAPTNYNFVSGDYDRKTGLVGNGSTKYLDSNRANNADPQNSQHFGVYFSNQGTSALGIWIGVFHSPESGSSYFYRNATNQVLHVSRRSSTETLTGMLIPDNSYMGVSRAAAGSYSFRMSSTTYSYTMASAAPAADNLHVFRLNRATNNLYMNARIAFYSIGEAVDLALLDTRLTTLMSALAAAIP